MALAAQSAAATVATAAVRHGRGWRRRWRLQRTEAETVLVSMFVTVEADVSVAVKAGVSAAVEVGMSAAVGMRYRRSAVQSAISPAT